MKELIEFITISFKKLGVKLTYYSLLLYYTLRKPTTPSWVKKIIWATIGYLISPIDFIPDLTPFIGYTDDLSVIILGLSAIHIYIDKEVRILAVKKLRILFPNVSDEMLEVFDSEIHHEKD